MDKKYTMRLTAPEKDNPYYLRKPAGLSTCIEGKPLYCKDSVLSNCYGFGAGRFSEMAGEWQFVGKGRPRSGDWFHAKDGFERGQEPRVGAMACWWRNDDKGGHVEIVEAVYPDGSVLDSYSAYNGVAFKTVKRSKSMRRLGSKFLGFIYPKYNYVLDTGLKVGDKVKILAKGNSRADGKGKASSGLGFIRYILAYDESKPYPYKIGSKKGVVTGYYKAEALKQL